MEREFVVGDVVNFSDKVGTIVEHLFNDIFEVEVCGKDGKTLDFYAVDKNYMSLVK
jgi:hypothetical protein